MAQRRRTYRRISGAIRWRISGFVSGLVLADKPADLWRNSPADLWLCLWRGAGGYTGGFLVYLWPKARRTEQNVVLVCLIGENDYVSLLGATVK